MASIKDKLKSSYAKIANRTMADENLRMGASNIRAALPQIGRQLKTRGASGSILDIGRFALQTQPARRSRPLSNYLEGATRAPAGLMSGLSYGMANAAKNRPALTPGGQAGEMLGSMYGFGKSPITQGILKVTDPLAFGATRKIAPKLTPLIGGAAPRVAAAGSNILQGIAFDKAGGYKTTPGSVALDAATGLAVGPNMFANQAKNIGRQNFTLDRRTLDELVQAEDMLKNPRKYLGKIPTGKRNEKEALKAIQENAVEVVERLSAKYLPDKQLYSLKTPLAKLNALAVLHSQNRLANVPGMGLVDSSGTFKAPYKRGDIAKIQKMINGLIGGEVNTGNWKRDYAYTEKLIEQYRNDPDAPPEFRQQLTDLAEQLELAKEAKLAPQPQSTVGGVPIKPQDVPTKKEMDVVLGRKIDVPDPDSLPPVEKGKIRLFKGQQGKFTHEDIWPGKYEMPKNYQKGDKFYTTDPKLAASYAEDYAGKLQYIDVPKDLPKPTGEYGEYLLPSKPQSTVGGVTINTKTTPPSTQTGKLPQTPKVSLAPVTQTTPLQKLPMNQTARTNKSTSQPFDSIIAEGRKSIGVHKEKSGQNLKQTLDTLYTQWVDRFHPLSKASKQAKTSLKQQGAALRPEADPDYLVRRLTGAGSIADQRFQQKLNPILKEFEASDIEKADMDTYLAHNRMLGFDQVGREIYGVDAAKSQRVVQALEQKYPGIQNIAQKFYQYEDEGLQELAKSGFFSQADIQAMRSQNPNYAPLYRVMDEMDDYLGVPTRKTMQGTSPVKKIKGSKRQILSPVESIIGDTFRQRAAIEKNRVAQSIINLQKVADMGFEKVSKSTPETITVWNNGQKEYWRVGQDIADVAKGANEEAMNLMLKIAQAPAQILRQGATGRNPAFIIPNIVRDQLDASITSKYGYIPFVDYVSGLKSMIKNDEMYQSWQKSGAKIDLGEMSGRKSIGKYAGERASKKHLRNWLTEGLDVMGKYSEQPTRVGLYKKAFNKTRNPLLAAMESRDATVDFARMGSKMKTANSIIPFLNVGVQGFDKLMRSVKNNPGKVLLNMSLYAAAPAAAITAYNLKNYPEEYNEIPQYEKDSNFVIVKGRNENGTVDYFTIPKGHITPIAANPIQSFMEHLAGVDGKSFSELATSILSDTLPVIESGNTPKEVIAKTVGSITPQAIKPVVEDIANRQFYKYDAKKEAQGKDSGVIVPSYLKDKPAYQQTYEFTPQMYQKIGAALNVSPLRAKAFMESYLAGYAKVPAQMVEMLYSASRGEKISPNDKTVLSRFVKQTYPSSGGSKPKEKAKVPGLMERLTGKVGAVEDVGVTLPATKEDLSVLYKDADQIIKNFPSNRVKAQYGLVDKTLDEYQEEMRQAVEMKQRIEKEHPEKVFEIELDMYDKESGATVVDRTAWVVKQLQNSKDPKATIQKLYDGQVLTESVVEALNKEYKLGLTKYNYGDGYRSVSGSGKGKKAKKLISDAQILSAYKKALEASYKRPQSKEVRSISRSLKPVNLKRSEVKLLY